jgi:serine/threonine protein kinase
MGSVASAFPSIILPLRLSPPPAYNRIIRPSIFTRQHAVSRPRDFLGSYRLARLIRVGHTCQVWEAAKTDVKERFVLKVLRQDLRNDRQEIAALKNEFECGKSLKHKNIIKIHDFAVEGGAAFVVMEHFEHPNLKLWLREPQKIAYLSLKIIEQAAEALFYMHEQGWVHRDVKPDNFLVSNQGTVKLIDFAISIKQKSSLAAMFSFGGGKVMGTRSYMSPEQIRGKNLDARADIYSFGCVLFELMTAKCPFTGTTADELLAKHLTAPIPSIQVHNDNVTPEFAELVKKLMAKNPADRPASLWEFLKVFRSMRVFKILPKAPADTTPPEDPMQEMLR